MQRRDVLFWRMHKAPMLHLLVTCPYQLPQAPLVLSENDPLYSVLKEDQVGIHHISGRPHIVPEILEEMRNYLLASCKEDRHVREQRVISFVKEAEQNFTSQKTILQLIPPPIFTTDLNKGKSVVFDYDENNQGFQPHLASSQPKLMA